MITRTSEIDKNDTISIDEFTWKNTLHRYKNRSKDMSKINLYKYTSFRFLRIKSYIPSPDIDWFVG